MPQPRKRKPSKEKVETAWKEFYQSPEGRIAIGALMDRCGMYSAIVASDGFSGGIAIGERNIGAWLAGLIAARPQEYVEDRVDLERMFDPPEPEITPQAWRV
jgi:hypothetical protein